MLAVRLGCVVVVAACSQATVATHRVATLGYAHPPRLYLATRGKTDLVEPWRDRISAASQVVGNADNAQPIDPGFATGQTLRTMDQERPLRPVQFADENVCRAASELPVPVDEIALVTGEELFVPNMHCVESSCTPPKNWFGEGSSGESTCGCDKYEYVSGVARVAVHFELVDPRACTVVRRIDAVSHEQDIKTGDEHRDRAEVHGILARANAASAGVRAGELFPDGIGLLSVSGSTIEVANDRTPRLVAGTWYWLRSPRGIAVDHIKVRVIRADDHTATLEAEQAPGDVRAGDELHLTSFVYRVSGYLGVGGGIATARTRAADLSAAIAFRWSFDRYPVMVEAEARGDLLPGLNTARASLGGAAGLRWPIGPIDPVAFGEVGLAKANQDNAGATGVYGGLGAGVELWLGKVFVFGDARWRKYAMQGWQNDKGAPLTVTYPDLDTMTFTVQVGAGEIY